MSTVNSKMADPSPINHPPLDALIQLLENSEEDEIDGDNAGRESDNEEVPRDVDIGLNNNTNLESQTLVPETPVTPRRRTSGIISKYLSSPHARRERVKQIPCIFCVENKDVFTLGHHLENSILCRNNYFSLFHVRSIDAVLSKTFVCLFCQDVGATLKPHLRSTQVCFEAYCEKFNVDTIE